MEHVNFTKNFVKDSKGYLEMFTHNNGVVVMIEPEYNYFMVNMMESGKAVSVSVVGSLLKVITNEDTYKRELSSHYEWEDNKEEVMPSVMFFVKMKLNRYLDEKEVEVVLDLVANLIKLD